MHPPVPLQVPLVCNRCYGTHPDTPLRGRVFVTNTCQHVVCAGCAERLTGSHCPICGTTLSDEEVTEVYVGLRSHSNASIRRTMLEAALSGSYWSEVTRNAGHLLVVATDIMKMSQRQLLFEVAKREKRDIENAQRLEPLLAELEEVKLHSVRQERVVEQRTQDLQTRLDETEKRLHNVTEGYKEKSKRCDAWESAYRQVAGRSDKPRPAASDAGRGAGAGASASAEGGTSAPATRTSRVDAAAAAATATGFTTADHRLTGPVPVVPPSGLTQGQTTTLTQRHMPPAITNAAHDGPLKRPKPAEATQSSPAARGMDFFGRAAPQISPPAAPTFTTTLKQGTFFSHLR